MCALVAATLTRPGASNEVPADAANKAKSGFLENRSHKFRTPLDAIIGSTEMVPGLARDDSDGDDVPALDKVVAAARHRLGLVEGIRGDITVASEAGK